MRLPHRMVRWVLALALLTVLATAAAAQDAMTVRAEPHDGFSRLIFAFPERLTLPEYAISDDNGVLVLTFTEPVSAVLPDVAGLLPADVTVARFDPDGRGARFGLARPLELSVREAGEELYVDMLPANWVGLPPSLPDAVIARLALRAEEAAALAEARRRAQLIAELNPTVTVRVGRLPTLTRVVFDWSVGTEGGFSHEGDSVRVNFDWPVEIDIYPLVSDRPAVIASAAADHDDLESVVDIALAPETEARFYQESANRYVLDLVAADAGHAPASAAVDLDTLLMRVGADPQVLAQAEHAAAPAAGAEAVEHAEESGPAPTSLTPIVSQVGLTTRLSFPFRNATAAAVFRRGDVVWMIFDTPLAILEPERAEMLAGIAEDFSVVGAGTSQVVRMRLGGNRLATIGTEGEAWVLSLGDLLLNAAEPLVLARRGNATWPNAVVADLVQPGRVHSLRDPDVGDVLDVVTVYPPARAVVRDLEFVDFSAPQSIHGLVIRPKLTALSVVLEDNLAVISAEQGLRLSPPVDRRLTTQAAAEQQLMSLGAQYVPTVGAFIARREALAARAATSEGAARDHARFELATYLIGNGMGPEALGVLDVMANDLRVESLAPQLTLARASAQVLLGHHDLAAATLSGNQFDGQPEGMFWRALARVGTGDYAGARLDALSAIDVADAYPAWLRGRFLLAAITAAVEQEDAAMAQRLLTAIDVSTLNPEQMSRYELLSGRLDELSGRDHEALEAYGRVLAADIRTTVPEAVLHTVGVLDRLDALDTARAIDTLATQATIWRGDAVEEDLLTLLAELQFREGLYRDGFTTVRDMSLAASAGSRQVDEMATLARTQFERLYLDGEADQLDPVEALAIYYDFRQLTPVGAAGDAMIRNLAQRLVSVDLLAQAADLLEYQVDQRLDGAARAQVAADLALVQIADRDPEAALQVLYRTRLPGLPPALERQRRVLEARALIDSRRQDLALDMLTSLSGRDADLLRVEALWQGQRYREAAELIEGIYAADLSAGPLSAVARMNVVKAAVGYVLANDTIGLARLRSRYSAPMSSAPEWPMFSYVTEVMDPQSQAFVDIAREIAATDSLGGFLNAYRRTYQPEDAIVPNGASEGGPETVAEAGR